MPIPKVDFEGEYIPINTVPAGAIRIADKWYLDPDKIPEEYKAERMRLSSYRATVARDGVLAPDMQEALKKKEEDIKKKSKNSTPVKDAPPVNAPS